MKFLEIFSLDDMVTLVIKFFLFVLSIIVE